MASTPRHLNRRALLALIGGGLAAGACSSGPSATEYGGLRPQPMGPGEFPNVEFATWTDAEPDYLLYPGDVLDIQTPTAPELNRAPTIAPDGRITLPLIGQVMAADRSIPELKTELEGRYASQLVRPVVEIAVTTAQPLKVWVDGEVRTPGVYDMPGDIDAYQAVVLAGGFLPSARQDQVALIRRGPAPPTRRDPGPAPLRHPVRAAHHPGRGVAFLQPNSRRPADRVQLFDQRPVPAVLTIRFRYWRAASLSARRLANSESAFHSGQRSLSARSATRRCIRVRVSSAAPQVQSADHSSDGW